jgi:hypothetical protein
MIVEGDLATSIARAVESRDYLRRPSPFAAVPPGHKEWLHFAVYAEGLDLLVNFSIVDDIRPRAPRGAELGRLTCLVRSKGWDGDVDAWSAEAIRAPSGELDVTIGPSSVRFEGGVFRIQAELKRRPIRMDLTLRPVTFPSEANNIDVEDGPPINWMVLPRLVASGIVEIGDEIHRLNEAPAYHDHNWGRFRWGRNFAWEWGYALPAEKDNPWSVVFVRLTDRGHVTCLMQAVFVWKGCRQHRVFRDRDLTVQHAGFARPSSLFKLPRIMGLVSPERTTDVPSRLIVDARQGGDCLHFEFEAEDVGQVIIPNDDDLGVTIINEVSGELQMEGSLDGAPVSLTGRSICEFLGA